MVTHGKNSLAQIEQAQLLLLLLKMFIAKYFQKKQQLEEVDGVGFLKVEFLTQEQKIKKDIALQNISKMYPDIDDDDVILNKDDLYQVSFRNTFTFKNKTKLKVAELLALFKNVPDYSEVEEFINREVQTIDLIMYNHKAIQPDNFVPLMDIGEQLENDEGRVLQFIYKRTSILKRVAIGVKKAVMSIPRLLFYLLCNLMKILFDYIRPGDIGLFGSGVNIVKSVVGTKLLMVNILIPFITMLFPFLVPFFSLAKLI